MKVWSGLAVALAFSLFLGQAGALAADSVVTTSPGTTNVYTSGNITFAGHIADLTGTLAKGKRGTVLEIEGQGQVFGCTGNTGLSPIVNFEAANFGDTYIVPTVEPFGGSNSNSGVWWLDLDAAEANSPGDFIDKPINITLRANSIFCPDGAIFTGTLRARLVKK